MEGAKLEYRVVIRPLSPDEGGGWLAEIPDLEGCMSDGETMEEALRNLEEAKAGWMETAQKMGWNIPQPSAQDDTYSGKFTLRLPKSLHKRLAMVAEKEGVSLNQYLLYLITANQGAPIERSAETQKQRDALSAIELRTILEVMKRLGSWHSEESPAAMLPTAMQSRMVTPHALLLNSAGEDWQTGQVDRNRIRVHQREGS